MQSIRVFIDASNDKVAVVELRCFGYQCFVVWSRSEGITKAIQGVQVKIVKVCANYCGKWQTRRDRRFVSIQWGTGEDSSLPRLCRASAGKMADSTRSSSRGKLFRCLFHEGEFPLHWVWGKLAELWQAGLVWTPRLGVPQIPSAGPWERSRYATAVESYTPAQGDGRGLPRPRQIPSPPGDPWTCLSRPFQSQ